MSLLTARSGLLATSLWVSVGCAADQEVIGPLDAAALTDLGAIDAADTATTSDASDALSGADGATSCVDTDRDGISDSDEGAPDRDSDTDGTPDFRDDDSDNDGFADRDEAQRRYAGFEGNARARQCGQSPDNCDAPQDGLYNARDPDSDNDGLLDAEERLAHTNPCAEDTDGDGASDLAERVARSDPTMASSRPPANSLYVTLPYYAPETRGPHELREFTFQTSIRQADLFFLVDNSASMEPTIENLRQNLGTVIVPGVRMAIPDVRVGVGSFDSMPDGEDGFAGSPGDYTLWVRQRLSPDAALSQRALDSMHTIVTDTAGRFLGGATAECQIEALFEVIEGTGTRMHQTDPNALRSVRNALDPAGNGWVPAVDPARDCPDGVHPFGWACFEESRVPIVVLVSDGPWYDGPQPGSPVSIFGHRYADLVSPMLRRGAFFVGIDVSRDGTMGFTYANSVRLALATRTLNAMRREVVFAPASTGGLARTSMDVVAAIRTLATESRQDISTNTLPDPAETRLSAPHSTANFILSVRPLRAEPPSPDGFERSDDRTFYNVLPSTRVVFAVDFYNNFVVGGDAAQVFQATVVVRGRAGTEVDRRPVFVVVPARGGGLPPG